MSSYVARASLGLAGVMRRVGYVRKIETEGCSEESCVAHVVVVLQICFGFSGKRDGSYEIY